MAGDRQPDLTSFPTLKRPAISDDNAGKVTWPPGTPVWVCWVSDDRHDMIVMSVGKENGGHYMVVTDQDIEWL